MNAGNWKMQTVSRHWLNLETFILCLNDVALMRKTNLCRTVGPETGVDSIKLLPGIEINLHGGQVVEVDYLEEFHRDQVYNAIWGEIEKAGGAP